MSIRLPFMFSRHEILTRRKRCPAASNIAELSGYRGIVEHNELANRILKDGNEIYVEAMNFRAPAKKAKRQNPEEIKPGGKYKRRKRFGKSLTNKPRRYSCRHCRRRQQRTAELSNGLTHGKRKPVDIII